MTKLSKQLPCSGIYAIRNTTTDRVYYVGSTVNLAQRWGLRVSALRHRYHSNRALQADWNAHGPATFQVELLERLPPDPAILDRAEQREAMMHGR